MKLILLLLGWTAVFPDRYFLWKLITVVLMQAAWQDSFTWPLVVFLLSCCIYPLASSCAHTFSTMSMRARHICFFFDYGALSFYSLGKAFMCAARLLIRLKSSRQKSFLKSVWIKTIFYWQFVALIWSVKTRTVKMIQNTWNNFGFSGCRLSYCLFSLHFSWQVGEQLVSPLVHHHRRGQRIHLHHHGLLLQVWWANIPTVYTVL